MQGLTRHQLCVPHIPHGCDQFVVYGMVEEARVVSHDRRPDDLVEIRGGEGYPRGAGQRLQGGGIAWARGGLISQRAKGRREAVGPREDLRLTFAHRNSLFRPRHAVMLMAHSIPKPTTVSLVEVYPRAPHPQLGLWIAPRPPLLKAIYVG